MKAKYKKLKLKNEYFLVFLTAIVMGILGQTMIPWLSYKLNLYYFEFRFLISNIDIYPFIVVLLICLKNTDPKKAFFRISVYFTGLCLGYYGYTSIVAICNIFTSGNANYLVNILSDLKDSFEYIFIGILAGIWGFLMLKYKSKKYVYGFMMLPFIVINLYVLYSNFTCNPPQIFMIVVDFLGLIGIILCLFNNKIVK